jgi:mRNA capping enzyme, catalytic domain/mRNA capping enzyme, beta chain/mRNA capping enzyme, C-terminal domain
MSKRPGGGFDLKDIAAKQAKMNSAIAASGGGAASSSAANGSRSKNPYLSMPVIPEKELQKFLGAARNAARRFLPNEQQKIFPITKPFCEIEARLGVLKVPHASPARRVTPSGASASHQGAVAFDCSQQEPRCQMESGISRTHFLRWTSGGLSQIGPLTMALGVTDARQIKEKIVETEMVETVYIGYRDDRRVCFPGIHPPPDPATQPVVGKMETKEKLAVMDLTVPSAPYDLRITLSSEKVMDANVRHEPPPGWTKKRIKRRRSYYRRDKTIAWQIDVTEVTTLTKEQGNSSSNVLTNPTVDYELEMELLENVMLNSIVNEQDEGKLRQTAQQLAGQSWWILKQLNPLHEALDVEETLRDHPNKHAVQLALAQCGAMKQFMDKVKSSASAGSGDVSSMYDSPIGKATSPPASLSNISFCGCMPVNFSRHNIEEIQRSPDNAYFLSEKTDGVRHFLIFTGDTAVLVDRAMRGKQPIPVGNNNANHDPFAPFLSLIQPGTVLDGEVVMNRGRPGSNAKPRPIFIVFDVMAISTHEPVLHLPFEQRLQHLRRASFRTKTANRDMFDPNAVASPHVALPLVRKNFVKRTDLDELLSHVVEEHGMRCYRNGDLHNHLTDGIIFQPNRPYVCGTDKNLLKWKYLDTVTIDVELMPLRHNDADDDMRTGCLGEEQTRVDMSRYILLPNCERMRLEADKFESGGRIAEVGFDPETGEWYYLTMRSDKTTPNHISTVLGTLLELAESLTTDELRYRMSIPAGQRDTYRKEMRGMLKQLLDHQRKRLAAEAGPIR